jgi:hypothetical protein
MPFEIVWEPRGVYKRFWGFVTDSEFIRSVRAAQEDPRFDDIHYNINDYLAVEDFDVSMPTIAYAAALNIGARFSRPRIRVALVTTNERVIGLAKYFMAPEFASYPMRVFATLESAREWVEAVEPG